MFREMLALRTLLGSVDRMKEAIMIDASSDERLNRLIELTIVHFFQ
jgi:hypothetical protein